MNRTLLLGSLSLAVGGLLIAGTGAPATAAGSPRPTPPKASKSQAVKDARASIAAHPKSVRAGAGDTFTSSAVLVDKDGTRHVHMERSYEGLPVLGGDVIVHSAPSGAFRESTVTLKKPLSLSTAPAVSATSAEATARKMFKGKHAKTSSKLVVDAVTGATPKLAWQVTVDGIAPDQSPSHYNVLVDALTGKAGQTWNDFHTATGTGHGYQVGDVSLSTTAISGGYQMKDGLRGNGETRDANNQTAPGDTPPAGWGSAFTDTDNVWGNGTTGDRATVAADAHYGIQATWDYYKNVHGRSGIKNDGVGARSFVHYGQNYANAGWDDTSFSMIYGDGGVGQKPFTEIDVAGHEMSHGVTSATANLNYFGDAGGLNESTSDIFGTLVEFNANNSADAPDYLIGEKIDINGNGTPLRWMDDPSKDGASDKCWSTATANKDPHYSSGVGNHFFYLLAVGSGSSSWGNSPTCNASTVTGIGNDAAGKIWYRALSTYMTSGTTYPQARTASVKAAIDLYGATSTQCAAVEKAWSAVSVAASGTTCGGTGGGSNLLSNPGFESGATAWTASTGVITNDVSGTPHSGSYYAWLDGYGTAHTDTLSQSVTIPSSATAPKLSFYLDISTEESGTTAYDTLRAQVVSGSTTTTLATYSNANAGAYALRTLDLSAFKGQTVTIKFTGTEDSSLATSFLIDDTAVTTS